MKTVISHPDMALSLINRIRAFHKIYSGSDIISYITALYNYLPSLNIFYHVFSSVPRTKTWQGKNYALTLDEHPIYPLYFPKSFEDIMIPLEYGIRSISETSSRLSKKILILNVNNLTDFKVCRPAQI